MVSVYFHTDNFYINQYFTIMYRCIILSVLADIDITSTSSAQDKANKDVECQQNPSEGDLSTIKTETDASDPSWSSLLSK